MIARELSQSTVVTQDDEGVNPGGLGFNSNSSPLAIFTQAFFKDFEHIVGYSIQKVEGAVMIGGYNSELF